MKGKRKISHRKTVGMGEKSDCCDGAPIDLIEEEWKLIMNGKEPRLETLLEELPGTDMRELKMELNLLILSAICGRDIDRRCCELLSFDKIEKVQKAICTKIFGDISKA